MRDVIGKLGRMVLVAIALPEYVRGKVLDLKVAHDEARGLCDMIQRTKGERDEARRNEEVQRAHADKWFAEAVDNGGHVARLRDEAKILKLEAKALRADMQALTDVHSCATEALSIVKGEREELARRCDRLTERAEAAERHVERAMRDGAEAVKGWTETGKRLDDAQRVAEGLRKDRDFAENEASWAYRQAETLDIVYPIGWAAIVERDTARACLAIERDIDLGRELSALKGRSAASPCAWCHGVSRHETVCHHE